jgi:4-hydroxybenzoate polyprenyltransferase
MKGKLLLLVESGRPSNYYKNIVLFIPILFTYEEYDLYNTTSLLFGFIIFCMVSSGVYMMNDIYDIEKDKNHSIKKNKPITSGRISVREALISSFSLISLSFIFAYFINTIFLLIICSYVVINLAYSKFLKNIVLLDILIISFGFLLRAYSGLILSELPFSFWFLLIIYFLALFLAINKRKAELINNNEKEIRKVSKKYNLELLNELNSTITAVLIVSYSFYTFQQAENHLMIITIPNIIYGLFRYSYLNQTYGLGERTHEIIRDKPSIANILIYILLTIIFLQVL